MSDDSSIRLALPLLQAGQAQKEIVHNEALTLLDLVVQSSVIAVAINMPPAGPAIGQCWVVGSAPTGAWTGRAGWLAGWTDGGWRFVAPFAGMAVWSLADGAIARFAGDGWGLDAVRGARLVLGGDAVVGPRQPAIPAPGGGAVTDGEARAAIGSILAALRAHGLIAV